jgi:hypothetical protein
MNRKLHQLFNQVLTTRVISQHEHEYLQRVLQYDEVNTPERVLAKRLCYGVRRGLVSLQ